MCLFDQRFIKMLMNFLFSHLNPKLNDTIHAKKSFISVANIGCHGSRELYPMEIAVLSTRQECIGPASFYIRANGALLPTDV